MNNCEQLREHYESYALGALEGEERAEIEAHLARGCPVCTIEVERAHWLVAQVAYLAPETEPPQSLRRTLLEATRPARPSGRQTWIPVWAWVGAAALVLFAVYSIRQTQRLREEVTALQAQVEAQRSEKKALEADRHVYQRALAILSASETRGVKLKPGDASLPEFLAYWHPELGVVVSGEHIPLPAADRTFQLWVVPKQGNPVSAGIFRPESGGKVLHITAVRADLTAAAALAITDEPAGGRPQPTTKPLWVGPIS